jgi:hypothetical protein
MFCNWQQKVNSHHGKYQHWETTGAGKTNIQTTIMWKTITSREWVLHLQALLTTSYGYLQWLQRILLSLLTDLTQSRVDRCFSETSALLFITAWNDLTIYQRPLSSHMSHKSWILTSQVRQRDLTRNMVTILPYNFSCIYFKRRGSCPKLNLVYDVKGLALSTGNASCLLSTTTLLLCEK